MKEIPNEVLLELGRLESMHSTQRSKYRRNLRMFEYSPLLSIESMDDASAVGYYQQGYFDIEDDTTSSVQENIIRSCIETLIADVASRKVTPVFDTLNGTFKDIQVVKQLQQFFDVYYRDINLNKLVTRVFQDACIFEQGCIYVDRDTFNLERVLPWQIYVDSREASYGKLTKAAWKREQYPVSLLPLKKKLFGEMEYVTYWNFWDLNEGKRYYYIPEIRHFEEETWDKPLPFVLINYSSPVKGTSCQSIVDLLYGLQMAIDAICVKIKDASQLAPVMTYFVPDNGDGPLVKVKKMSNRIGEIVSYPTNGGMTGCPVTVATHPFMDPQWPQLLDKFKQDATDLVGISDLSRASKKPAGLDSGKALETLENIEANRFETQLNNVIRMYTDITKLIIDLVDENDIILPVAKYRPELKWSDVIEVEDKMSISFTAGEMFSSDPEKKLQQILLYKNAGILTQARANMLLEVPDSQQGYGMMNNDINTVMKAINDCLEYDVYDYPIFVPNELLKEEIAETQKQLYQGNYDGRNDEDIEKLYKLLQVAMSRDVNSMTSAEMAAANTINQEIMADMADPNGQINTAINQANGMMAQNNTTNSEEVNTDE